MKYLQKYLRYTGLVVCLFIYCESLCAEQKYPPAQAKLMARRAARVDALRQLTEVIYGTKITSETYVKDVVTRSDKIESKFQACIRGAREIECRYYEDYSAEVTMEIEVGRVTDILGCTMLYEGKIFKATGFGAPPDIDFSKSLAVQSQTAKKEHKKEPIAVEVEQAAKGKPSGKESAEIAESAITEQEIQKMMDEVLAKTQKPGKEPEQTPSQDKQQLPPKITIVSPEGGNITTADGHIRIQAKALSPNNEPITDIWIEVDGKRQDTNRGIGVVQKDTKVINGAHAEIGITVYLDKKDSSVTVAASNKHGKSVTDTIQVVRTGIETVDDSGNISKPDLYVLSIGVSECAYPDKAFALDFAHKDAAEIADALETQNGKLYQKVYKRTLINKDANRSGILGGLRWILQGSTQKDTAIIFLAGHGLKDDLNNYYFLPYDGDPDKLWETGVKWHEFKDVITSLPSKVILLVDTCHGGSVTGKTRGVADITDALRQLASTESGVVVMAACTGKESGVEHTDWGHGAFTMALLDGMKGGADQDADNIITVKELDLYTTRRVKELTGGKQHPTTEFLKISPDFPVILK
ncbi:MAG TPA: hypothetical protein ACFYEF_03070 [Candidatus Wunengus sp. YC63]|uniref:hypothetical protein n=1 Tax=Candidatus Wunengus sp. YC63 TaxID=3367699 RepID=UPI00402A04CD